MSWLRSTLFDLMLCIWTIGLGVLTPFVLPSRFACLAVARVWNRGVLFWAQRMVGMQVRFAGEENRIDGPAIYASKHQSALDTFSLWLALGNPAFVLKKELLSIPIFGWFLARTDPIAIDRSAGKQAVDQIAEQAKTKLAQGRSIVIFPEGTRRTVDAEPAYKSGGIWALYQLGYPVVPVALNTGICWPKHGLKRAGNATIQFLPALSAELSKEELMSQLQNQTEAAMANLFKVVPGGVGG